ncbi:MAG: hydroxymethylbilane synthase [Schwartzia sp.]|nr:hydroxymethylbilane synthase [Schwartzia sp. (in: firmicutes)]
MKSTIKIGTRQSALALWQAEYVAKCLRDKYPGLTVELIKMTTKGDRVLDAPLAKIGGKGLFTKELETAMLEKRTDIAVHSLKDMPTVVPDGLTIACITERYDVGDAFVSNKYDSLAQLPKGAVVGTSSLRRKAQLLAMRPDLDIRDLRGNVNSRLAKLDAGEYDAAILACAGLKRLGFGDRIKEIISRDDLLPAVGQGALAIEAREDDPEILELIEFLNDDNTRSAASLERAFLARVEGGCQVPVGVYARAEGDTIEADAVIASLDGARVFRGKIEGTVSEAANLGRQLAEDLLADGALEIMHELGLLEDYK